ncbi:MAG: hypothetical protein H6Q15_2209 [Bacteroidetes bacterium]|nr:hypothetical protein [Bacteroidota bacterium]
MLVKIEYLEKYITGAVIGEDLFMKMMDASFNGHKQIDVTKEQLDELERKSKEYLDNERALYKCCDLNNKGIAFEKEGKINLAIAEYEKNIVIGYPAHHSYKRLMIIYKKAKDYENERRVILRALEIFPVDKEYLERLEKATKEC